MSRKNRNTSVMDAIYQQLSPYIHVGGYRSEGSQDLAKLYVNSQLFGYSQGHLGSGGRLGFLPYLEFEVNITRCVDMEPATHGLGMSGFPNTQEYLDQLKVKGLKSVFPASEDGYLRAFHSLEDFYKDSIQPLAQVALNMHGVDFDALLGHYASESYFPFQVWMADQSKLNQIVRHDIIDLRLAASDYGQIRVWLENVKFGEMALKNTIIEFVETITSWYDLKNYRKLELLYEDTRAISEECPQSDEYYAEVTRLHGILFRKVEELFQKVGMPFEIQRVDIANPEND